MSQRLNVADTYDIVYHTSFEKLTSELQNLELTGKKACLVTDSNVAALYAEELTGLLRNICKEVTVFTFSAGEQQKTLQTVENLYLHLIEHQFDRKDFLVALGGGVTGDLAGFAAATFLRGIDFIQIPTTLLSQVDSSIGGKTGVDLQQYKNMAGAFHMPRLVYMNLTVLKDLEDRQYYAGFAEVMKSALIGDAALYEWLISNLYEICDRDMSVLQEMVYRTCQIKKRIVEKDPYEKGERALLNLGHTIGHALEKSKGFTLLHGECVALGCVAAAHISYQKQFLSAEEYYEIRDMFVPFQLPISVSDIDPEEILHNTRNDKKMEGGKIRFILLKKIGKAIVDTTVTDEEIRNAIGEIHFREEDWNE